jgi:hypothetical protein
MEQIIATIFSEKWIIYGLFALSFILAVWKGIPALFNLIFTQQAALQQAQHQLYKEELNNITQTFIQSINISNEWHQSHSAELKKNSNILENISNIIEKKYQQRSR